MKRILIGLVLMVSASLAIFDDEPVPIEIKPTIERQQKQWELTGAYYCKVKMPDGSVQELKSLKPLTEKGWLELAEKVYVKPIEPSFCPYCGQQLPEGFVQ